MYQLAGQPDGFLGGDSARQDIGITISYWKNYDSIMKWKRISWHLGGRN